LTIFCQIDKVFFCQLHWWRKLEYVGNDEMERKAVTFATAQGSKAVGMYYISF
jgi:hypothetical protein